MGTAITRTPGAFDSSLLKIWPWTMTLSGQARSPIAIVPAPSIARRKRRIPDALCAGGITQTVELDAGALRRVLREKLPAPSVRTPWLRNVPPPPTGPSTYTVAPGIPTPCESTILPVTATGAPKSPISRFRLGGGDGTVGNGPHVF